MIQRALDFIQNEYEEITATVLEELSEKEGWTLLRYFSRLSREEAETLYFLLLTLHTTSGYIHGSFYAENVYYRPSSMVGQPGSFRLANFALAKRHDCPGADCDELHNTRINLGLQADENDEDEEEEEYEEWELEYFREREELRTPEE
ncbi:hypothetical protein JCM10213_005839 [Rhodosporidiobolus nylandii]